MVRERSDTVPSEPEALRLGEAGLRASAPGPDRAHPRVTEQVQVVSTRQHVGKDAGPCPNQGSVSRMELLGIVVSGLPRLAHYWV